MRRAKGVATAPERSVCRTIRTACAAKRTRNSRRADASDASAEVLEGQLQADPGPLDWHRIDASGGPDETLAAARRALGLG